MPTVFTVGRVLCAPRWGPCGLAGGLLEVGDAVVAEGRLYSKQFGGQAYGVGGVVLVVELVVDAPRLGHLASGSRKGALAAVSCLRRPGPSVIQTPPSALPTGTGGLSWRGRGLTGHRHIGPGESQTGVVARGESNAPQPPISQSALPPPW